MAVKEILPEKARPVEGVVDTGIVVIAHFQNPARKAAFEFLSRVLRWKKRCLIPTSTIVGAYHIMTEYIGVETVSAYRALVKTLETRSPAFHEDITIEATQDSLTYAQGYSIESWDGYLVSLAKAHNAPIIYSVDQELKRKVKEVEVVNPLTREDFTEYNKWLEKRLGTPRARDQPVPGTPQRELHRKR